MGLYLKQPAAPTGPAPMLADGTPDLSGVWLGNGANSTDITRDLKPGDSVVMLPWAEAVVKNRQSKDDPEANCLPTGIPRGSPYPWRIAQTPGIYFIVYEGNIHSWRQIFMDGRKHPDDPDPTWYGHSVGHWEGKTLVVDTVGFNDKFWFDYKGHPHTEKLHTVERYTRTDLGHMTIETTIDDPGAYEKPFTAVGRAQTHGWARADGVHLPGEQSGSAAPVGSGARAGGRVGSAGFRPYLSIASALLGTFATTLYFGSTISVISYFSTVPSSTATSLSFSL